MEGMPHRQDNYADSYERGFQERGINAMGKTCAPPNWKLYPRRKHLSDHKLIAGSQRHNADTKQDNMVDSMVSYADHQQSNERNQQSLLAGG